MAKFSLLNKYECSDEIRRISYFENLIYEPFLNMTTLSGEVSERSKIIHSENLYLSHFPEFA